MKKRLYWVILLAVVSICGLVAFFSIDVLKKYVFPMDAYKIYEKSVQKFEKLNSFDVNGTIDLYLGDGSDSGSIMIMTDARVENVNDSDIRARVDIGPNYNNEHLNYYYQDGYLYAPVNNMKCQESAESFKNNFSLLFMASDFQKEDFQEINVESNGEGYSIDFTVRGEALKKVFFSTYGHVLGFFDIESMSGSENNFKWKDVSGKILIDNNYCISNMTLFMPVDMIDGEDFIEMNSKMNFSYSNFDTGMAIEFPSDLDESDDFSQYYSEDRSWDRFY